MSLAVILVTLVVGLLFILYKRWAKLYDHWEERGVVHIKPYPFVGNMINNLLKRKTMGEIFRDISFKFNDHKFIGVYNFISADLLINDADYINTIFVKEFSSFADRGPDVKNARPMDKHLFLMNGAQWKGIRTRISPAFSSGKLKGMFPLMLRSYTNTSKYIDTLLKSDQEIKLNNVIDMFIVNVSASTIYGIDPSLLVDPNSEFKKVVDETSKVTLLKFLYMTINVFFPVLATKLNISPMGEKVEKYFIDLVLNTFKERVESGVARDDVVQQLLQLKQSGKIEVSQWSSEDIDEFGKIEFSTITETVEVTDDILVAQGFIFLMAGLDPLRSTLGMLLVELCKNKHVLDRLREEVKVCCDKHGGLTYQAVMEMEYLDACFSETMRLHPPVEFGARVCVKDFTFPDGFTVEKGTRVLIPTMRFLQDPFYFPEPDKFQPERFQTPTLPWIPIPFGIGPRMCIARRFALQEMKVFAASLVQDYDIGLDYFRTKLPVQTDKWFFLRRNVSPIHINFSRRNQTS